MADKQETARAAYTKAHIEAGRQLAELRDLLQNMPGSSSRTNWAEVGTVGHINDLLAQAIAHLKS